MTHSPRHPYYGWIIAGALATTQMTSWGVLYYAFAIILEPLRAELKWDQGTITGAFSLAILVSGIAAVPVGRWLDRFSARLIMSLGSCASVGLVVAWSQALTPPAFYLVWFLIGIAMATTLYEPAFTVVAKWFVQRRAWALTLITLGGGLASVVYVPTTEGLVSRYGWRPALLILAGLLALITIPLHALVLRRPPLLIEDKPAAMTPLPGRQGPERSVPARAAVREPAFWWLTAAYALTGFVFIAITVHLVPYLAEHGFSTGFAAATLSLLGGSQIPGRLVFAPLNNWLSQRGLMAAIFGVQALAVLILAAAPTEAGIVIFAVLFGSSAGASSPARGALLAETFGPAHYGSISGLQVFLITCARAVGPVGIGILSEAAGSYRPMGWLLAGLAIGALVAMLQMPVPGPHESRA